jgi:NAD+ diphosphatase
MDQNSSFISEITPPSTKEDPAWWFAFEGDKLLVRPDGTSISIPCLTDFAELGLRTVRQHYLGRLPDRHCYTVELAEGTVPPAGMTFQGLRQVGFLVDEVLFSLAGRALQVLEWDRTHQFCSRCGIQMRIRPIERAKECPQCGLLFFPRLAPAIIVAVTRGDELLLARSHRFPTKMYSVIAGFVEPGETLEHAVRREVQEEVGLAVKGIRYFGSQPWPFPHSLMIGFTASYTGGEITLDDPEIDDAGWYRAGNLPTIPGKISIARQLIDWFVTQQAKSGRGKRKKSS